MTTFDVTATVSVGKDKPEALAIARLAEKLARPLRPSDVLDELLGNRPEVLARRIIERCIKLGLLQHHPAGAVLTEAGRIALSHDEVLTPEQGLWRFSMVNDPLLPALVHAERLKSGPNAPMGSPEKVPAALKGLRGKMPVASLRDGHLLQLVELSEHGAPGPGERIRLQLTWGDRLTLRASLTVEGQTNVERELDLPPVLESASREALWRELVAGATGISEQELERWYGVARGPVVPTSFIEAPVEARRSFRRNLEVPALDLRTLGRFGPTRLDDVELVAQTEADAQSWLTWLQWESIDSYVTPSRLERDAETLVARLRPHRPVPLSPTALLERARRHRDERAWFLLAPSDLGLWS